MRLRLPLTLLTALIPLTTTTGCANDPDQTDGDGETGDPTTGDGDGDPTTGDGDGDPTTGDGDGDPTTGDGDGDPTTGDGDGDACPAGDEGCTCNPDDTCNAAYLSCEAGTCVDPLPDCGDGVVGDGESCDDGNKLGGDGCSLACETEALCLITNEGGSPVETRSLRIDQQGNITEIATASLAGDHSPAQWAYNRYTAAACGRRVYFAFEDSETVAGVEVGLDGTLSPIPELPGLADVVGLACDDAAGLLFTVQQTGTLMIRAHAIGEAGALSEVDSVELVYPMIDNLRRSAIARHPSAPQLFLGAVPEGMLGDPIPGSAWVSRLSYDPSGMLTTEQHLIEVGTETMYGLALLPGAAHLLIPGFGGGCFGWYELGPGGEIPAQAATSDCGTWAGSSVVGPDADTIYVMGDTAIRVGTFDNGGPTLEATVDTNQIQNHMQLLYGGEVLVVASATNSVVKTYAIADDQTTMTEVDSYATGSAEDLFQASAVVPCPDN